jgi:hypothetical protein
MTGEGTQETLEVAVCPDCEAICWIADPEGTGELYLMRLGAIPVEDCLRCTKAAEAVV